MKSHELIVGLDHVNLHIDEDPDWRERAEAFYGAVLGLRTIERPANTDTGRPGLWYVCGPQQLHLTTMPQASGANRASRRHPAFRVASADAMRARLERAGVEIIAGNEFAGQKRFFVLDPWGNRLEFVERLA